MIKRCISRPACGLVAAVVAALAAGAVAQQIPYIADRPAALASTLEQAVQRKGPGYTPRTRHLLADGRPRYINRLILEDSPYLIQHAHNPVDWYPWSEEAFVRARKENKPLLISIGYSTCHWCHVMERESFEDPGVADFINRHFIAIKVDRERRPDVDATYTMAALRVIGHSGWPLTAFATPQGQPFFAATYRPREPFVRTLQRVVELWTQENVQLRKTAGRVSEAVRAMLSQQGKAEQIGAEALDAAAMAMRSEFDDLLGGFGDTSKFPRATWLMFLQEHALRRRDVAADEMLTVTLDAMARGGIYDQVGGGFHRYTVDPGWETPHFEKMLYTQANLARVYLREWRRIGRPYYRFVATATLDYVLREMRSNTGGFFSATDADSAEGEGAFFVWTPARIRAVLEPEEADFALQTFGVTAEGNFDGATVLHLTASPEELAAELGLKPAEFFTRLDRIRGQLNAARWQRPAPHRDEKVLLGWNGLMISALSEAHGTLKDTRYLQAAERTAEYLWRVHRLDDGGFLRVSMNGKPSIAALLEDYAYYAEALVLLYDQTRESRWLERARQVVEAMMVRFWDSEHGGFFRSPAESATPLLVRAKDATDTALPSGNAIAARVLGQLARRTGEIVYRDRSNRAIAVFADRIQRTPIVYASMLSALAEMTDGEAGTPYYAAQGKVNAIVDVTAVGLDEAETTVRIHIAPGWHINAHQPLQRELIATELQIAAGGEAWTIATQRYPPPLIRHLGFQSEPLALYEGNVVIKARLLRGEAPPPLQDALLRLRLRVQACSDRVCLQPEWLTLIPTLAHAVE